MTPTYAPLVSGEAAAFSASVLAFAAVVVSRLRTQAVRLRRIDPGTGVGPLLSGVYRGRVVEMNLTACGTLSVTAHLLQTSRQTLEFGHADRVVHRWLPPLCRHRLRVWAGAWEVAVRGSRLFFTCHLPDTGPEHMGHALDLACDLADAVDTS